VTALAFDALDAARLGVHRSREPRGALPHIARVLNASAPINEHEAEIDVETLAIDATSFAEIRRRAGADPEAMAQEISDIVAERGKMQNPRTGSGGVALGRVRSVGERYQMADLVPGELVVPLASLIAIPLELEAVGPVTPAHPHVPVRGRAIVTGGTQCGRVPDDIAAPVALTAYDVYPAASYVRELAGGGDHVLVLGAGHAGMLAAAAASAAVGPGGAVTVVDVADAALERVARVAPGVAALRADVTQPLAVTRALAAGGGSPADLTLVCTSVEGAEGAALLVTAERGTIVFFSTATRFAAAALGADTVGSRARLVIPNGLTEDRGEYTFELLRSVPELRRAFSGDAR
jgi:L-erythro-3,5-diaminohexanoate dehydrogenase